MHTVEAMGPCESLTPCVSVRDIHHPRDALQLTPPPQVEGSPSSWTRACILPEETRAPYTCFPSFPSSWARVRCWQSETPTPDWAGEAGRESSGDTADCSGEGGGSSQRCPVTGAGGANHGMHTCPAVVILQEMFGSIIWVVPNSLILPKFSELPISSQFIFCLIHHNWVSLLGVSSRAQNTGWANARGIQKPIPKNGSEHKDWIYSFTLPIQSNYCPSACKALYHSAPVSLLHPNLTLLSS